MLWLLCGMPVWCGIKLRIVHPTRLTLPTPLPPPSSSWPGVESSSATGAPESFPVGICPLGLPRTGLWKPPVRPFGHSYTQNQTTLTPLILVLIGRQHYWDGKFDAGYRGMLRSNFVFFAKVYAAKKNANSLGRLVCTR